MSLGMSMRVLGLELETVTLHLAVKINYMVGLCKSAKQSIADIIGVNLKASLSNCLYTVSLGQFSPFSENNMSYTFHMKRYNNKVKRQKTRALIMS